MFKRLICNEGVELGFVDGNYKLISILGDLSLILFIIFFGLFFLYNSVMSLGLSIIIFGVFFIMSGVSAGRLSKYFFALMKFLSLFASEGKRKYIRYKNPPTPYQERMSNIFVGVIFIVCGLLIVFIVFS